MTELPTDSPQLAAPAPQRPGVPLWRVGKPDSFLAEAVATARTAILDIAADGDIGRHVGARSEGIRCVTHLFECNLPGYTGWEWFATITRVSRSKEATVNEVGLLPTNASVLAPPWVPWAERVRPEDAAALAAAEGPVDGGEEQADAKDDGGDAGEAAAEDGGDSADVADGDDSDAGTDDDDEATEADADDGDDSDGGDDDSYSDGEFSRN